MDLNDLPTVSNPSIRESRTTTKSIIGPSVTLKGDITGEEDIRIEGQIIEGAINFPMNTVTIGRSGRVSANVFAKNIIIEGQLTGDLYAEERIAILKTGNVHGNVTAPRVSLDDGAQLKGLIDMDPKVIAGMGDNNTTKDTANRQHDIDVSQFQSLNIDGATQE